eukprot:NODE_1376_length_1182_cov_38.347749_g1131_i0.p1 GENE.NODE_1376_length_1182_cov_38.347749_g1131_i0~~NODE_1376_length_1182_cov_38.347749_g1131_i0.p1  ORF type:complete len:274 (-),score=50.08 NODE_1376_length_1182_cov_38.347749_g1131_i0:198-1019(-)
MSRERDGLQSCTGSNGNEYWKDGSEYYTGMTQIQNGSIDPNAVENISSLSMCSGILLTSALRLFPGMEDYEYLTLASTAPSSLCYLMYFLLGFEMTGPFVVMIFRMIFSDMARFVVIYGFMLVSYSTAFMVLGAGKLSYSECISSCWKATLGDMNWDFLEEVTWPNVAIVLFYFWIVISCWLLVNLLVAMMGSTYETVLGEVTDVWCLAKLGITLSMEQRVPRGSYWITHQEKRYIRNLEPVGQDILVTTTSVANAVSKSTEGGVPSVEGKWP